MRLRVAVTAFTKTAVPMILKIYYIYLRNQQLIFDNLKNHLIPPLVTLLTGSFSTTLNSLRKTLTYVIIIRGAIRKNSPQSVEYTKPEESVECQVLFNPKNEILADVIFIHGLHGGVDKTWKQGLWRHENHKIKHAPSYSTKHSMKKSFSEIYLKKLSIKRNNNEIKISEEENGEWEVIEDVEVGDEDGYSSCWPQDWLPQDCPGARVIALNYTTDILWCPLWKKKRKRTDMIERSDEMIEQLVQLGVGKKPIIWVGHSKGGLFIKQIILNAWEKHYHRPEIFNIFQQSKGIMFYSVPHKGSFLADVALPLTRRSVEVIEIQRNCDFVLDLHKRFLEICQKGHFKAEIFSFIETSLTFMSFVYLKIVPYDSADPDIGEKCDVPLDHREICKPAGRDCFLYLKLVNLIEKQIPKQL